MPSKSERDLAALQSNFKALDEAVAAKFAVLDKQIAALSGIVQSQHQMILALQPKPSDTRLVQPISRVLQ